MPEIGFSKQFVEAVQLGTKRRTIRAYRKRLFKVGDNLYFKSGSRFKPVRFGEAVCTKVSKVAMCNSSIGIEVYVDKVKVLDLEEFWRADGFKSEADFEAWFFKGGNVFEGQMIEW
jgi:hypothetical protein